MALRAGYYGIKRAFRDKLEQIIPAGASGANKLTTQNDITDVYAAEGVSGVKNYYNGTEATETAYVFVKSSNRTHRFSEVPYSFKVGDKLRIQFEVTNCENFDATQTAFGIRFQSRDSGLSDYTASNTVSFKPDQLVGIVSAMCTITKDFEGTATIYGFIGNNQGDTATLSIKNLMVCIASDTDTIYQPYALTNQELTLSAADQKTTINAIIAAATDAADFAAFKTAMGAITPVTRSLSTTAAPEEIVKDEIEEPVVEKKTTTRKKSTAKADTQEEV